MQKLCTNCHYLGKSKKWDFSRKFLIIFFVFLALFFILLGFWHPLFVIGTYLSLLLVLAGFEQSIKNSNECPTCNHKTLIPANSHKAQEIVHANNLSANKIPDSWWDTLEIYDCIKSTKRKICSACKNIDDEFPHKVCSMRSGFIILSIGILTIPLALFHPSLLVFNFLYVFIGITTTITCFMEPDRCDKCRNRTLIPLNSPEGTSIIEQEGIYNVNIIDPTIESNLFFLHENYSYIILLFLWLVLGFSMYRLFIFFSNI